MASAFRKKFQPYDFNLSQYRDGTHTMNRQWDIGSHIGSHCSHKMLSKDQLMLKHRPACTTGAPVQLMVEQNPKELKGKIILKLLQCFLRGEQQIPQCQLFSFKLCLVLVKDTDVLNVIGPEPIWIVDCDRCKAIIPRTCAGFEIMVNSQRGAMRRSHI